MEITKVFANGRSQAVRIPKKYRFHTAEVEISRKGNRIILTPVSGKDSLAAFLAMPGCPDFEIDRKNAQKVQKRELFG